MSVCFVCNKEITAAEFLVNGRPAACAWIPWGAPQSAYAIVSAHLSCMTIDQLKQALKSWEVETKQRGYPALIVIETEKRLAHLLAGGAREEAPSGNNSGSRFAWLEID